MANAYSTSDLVKETLQKVGERTDGTSPYHSLALQYLNEIYLAVLSGSNEFDLDLGDPWPWAREATPKLITLLPAYETGTVTLTNGSASGTFSAAPTVSQTDRFLKITDRSTMYRISAHTASAQAFTLDSVYLEASGSGLSFLSIPIRYDLGANILRLVEPFRHYEASFQTVDMISTDDAGRVLGLDLNLLRSEFPLYGIKQGIPTHFATYRSSETSWLVEFNSYVETTMRLECDYIKIPEGLFDSDTSIPIVPRAYRRCLSYGATHKLLVDKEDAKAEYFLNATKSILMAMTKGQRKETTHAGSPTKGQLVPRQDQVRRNRQWY